MNKLIKHFEFWPPRLFELPYYLYLLVGACMRGLSVKSLAKANYGLDHGEIGIGSKYHTQMYFNQDRFLPTELIPAEANQTQKQAKTEAFAAHHGYPIILKSDIGSVGKGVVKVNSRADIPVRVAQLQGNYLLQKFTKNNLEYGVFYARHHGRAEILGINKKHFPTVVGDGIKNLGQLARTHYRYTAHWQTFLQYVDESVVPAADESVQLSFIGSHTMGCKFTEDTYLLTPALEQAIFKVFESSPGFNFGRLDIKAESEEAFRRGEFLIIEVNGVASLPTNMFDPNNSLWRGYSIFLMHGRHLLDSAKEHRHQSMNLDSYRSIIDRVKRNAALLNYSHDSLMGKE